MAKFKQMKTVEFQEAVLGKLDTIIEPSKPVVPVTKPGSRSHAGFGENEYPPYVPPGPGAKPPVELSLDDKIALAFAKKAASSDASKTMTPEELELCRLATLALEYRDNVGPNGSMNSPTNITDKWRVAGEQFRVDHDDYVKWSERHGELKR